MIHDEQASSSASGRPAEPRSAAPRYHDRTLKAIRRIIRAVDSFSHRLESQHGVTVPQLSCLVHIAASGPLSLTDLATAVEISPSTAVGIVDRLVRKGLATRLRSDVDRRRVLITASPRGQTLVKVSPSPMQDRLASALDRLPEIERAAITRSLERVVGLMGIEHGEASTILDTGVSLAADPQLEPDRTTVELATPSAHAGRAAGAPDVE